MFYDGNKLYGAPMGLSLVGVVYNTTLFQQLGLQIPTTFRRPGGPVRKVEGRRENPDGARGPGARALRQRRCKHGLRRNPNWNEDRAAGKVTFAGTPGWQLALQEFLDLNKPVVSKPAHLPILS